MQVVTAQQPHPLPRRAAPEASRLDEQARDWTRALAGCWSVAIGCVGVLVLADAGSWLLDFKPHVGCALVDTPPAGFGLDQGEPPSAEVIKGFVTHHSLKPGPFVNDLRAHPVFIHVHSEDDALAVE